MKSHRTTIAAFLLLALFVLGAPVPGIAGGCDEPGYTGGSCGKSETQGNTGGDTGSGDLGDEPGEPTAPAGGGSPGQVLPGTTAESASAEWSFFGDVARSVLTWLAVASTP